MAEECPSPSAGRYTELLREALLRQFTFQFSTRIRVKQRIGRLHRLLVLSSNEVKGTFLKPHFQVDFCLRPGEGWINDLLAVGCRADPFSVGGSVGELLAKVNRQRAAAKTEGAGDHDAAEGEGPDSHGAVEAAEAGKERASSSEPGVAAPDSLEDKVAQVCQPPETKLGFRYPFLGESVDIESTLDEVKNKHHGQWDRLHGKSLADLSGQDNLVSLRGIIGRAIQTQMDSVYETMERIQRRERVLLSMRSAPFITNPAYERRERRVFNS